VFTLAVERFFLAIGIAMHGALLASHSCTAAIKAAIIHLPAPAILLLGQYLSLLYQLLSPPTHPIFPIISFLRIACSYCIK
jgi:hypothetical protein